MGAPPAGLPEGPLGASWGYETDRAAVLAFDPDGKSQMLYATGIRIASALRCSRTARPGAPPNERDGLGDDLVPDYVTRVKEGAFYGCAVVLHRRSSGPRHPGAREDLKDKITVPDC